MPDIHNQTGLRRQGRRCPPGLSVQFIDLCGASGGGPEEIAKCPLDFAPAIRIRHHVGAARTMQKDASLQNESVQVPRCGDLFPPTAFPEIRPHTLHRTPVQVLRGIIAVADGRGDRGNPLVLIVRQRHEYMHQSWLCLHGGAA